MASKATVKPSNERYRSFVERVERLEEEKRGTAADISAVYAEAKADGFDVKQMRRHVRNRQKDSVQRATEDAVLETYMHALGDADEAPLFKFVGALSVDTAMRDQVIEACKSFVPERGEIIFKTGALSVRIWRDADGDVFAEDFIPEPPRMKGDKPSADGEQMEIDVEESLDVDPETLDVAGARALGMRAGRNGAALIANPYTDGNDPRYKAWGDGWAAALKEKGGKR